MGISLNKSERNNCTEAVACYNNVGPFLVCTLYNKCSFPKVPVCHMHDVGQ